MLIKNMIEDLGSPGEEPIPIMNVSIVTCAITPPPPPLPPNIGIST